MLIRCAHNRDLPLTLARYNFSHLCLVYVTQIIGSLAQTHVLSEFLCLDFVSTERPQTEYILQLNTCKSPLLRLPSFQQPAATFQLAQPHSFLKVLPYCILINKVLAPHLYPATICYLCLSAPPFSTCLWEVHSTITRSILESHCVPIS
jgi:hypothetical protein